MKKGLNIVYFAILLVLLTISLFFYWISKNEENKGILNVIFLNVGQGDSIYIITPAGRKVFIDGGPKNNIMNKVDKFISFYTNIIDIIVVSNPDLDHYQGFISLINKYKVDYLIESGTKTLGKEYEKLISDLKKQNTKIITAKRGEVIKLDEYVDLEILFPSMDASLMEINDGSLVAKLTYGSTSFLFMGDSTKKIEKYLIGVDGEYLMSDVVKIGHHGSKTSSSEEFLCKTKAKYAVISVGKKNRYGHPNKETIDNINKCGLKPILTSEKGNIIFESDGQNLNIRYSE